jgi:dihydrofolate reductase
MTVSSRLLGGPECGVLPHNGSKQKEDLMSRLLVRNYSISLDCYAAGPHQDLDNPLGIGGTQLHEWIFATRSGSHMIGREGGNEGLDDAFFSERATGVGATIMGRNMFGPIRGPWGRASGRAGGEKILPSITQSSY